MGLQFLRYLRMIPCVRINDFGARECQEYYIDNPRMKCRGGHSMRRVCIRVYTAHIAINIHLFPPLWAYFRKPSQNMYTKNEIRNFNKQSLKCFLKLFEMQRKRYAYITWLYEKCLMILFFFLINCICIVFIVVIRVRNLHQQYDLCLHSWLRYMENIYSEFSYIKHYVTTSKAVLQM